MARCLASYPVLLHCHDSVISRHLDFQTLATLTQTIHAPWLSLHLNLPESRLNSFWQRAGIPFPLTRRPTALNLAISNLQNLKNSLEEVRFQSSSPMFGGGRERAIIAIENQAHHRHSGHDYLVDPSFIAAIIHATDTHLLLDLGHARVSAAMRAESSEDYINQLPLDRVIELHISSPGLYRGRLRDLHQPLTEVDYALLRYTLEHCPAVKAVTLEYYGPAEILASQLHQLHAILAEFSSR